MDLDKFRVWQERHLLTFVFLVLQSTFLRWEMLEHVSEVDSESFRNWDVANFCPGVALKLRVHDGSRRFRPFLGNLVKSNFHVTSHFSWMTFAYLRNRRFVSEVCVIPASCLSC